MTFISVTGIKPVVRIEVQSVCAPSYHISCRHLYRDRTSCKAATLLLHPASIILMKLSASIILVKFSASIILMKSLSFLNIQILAFRVDIYLILSYKENA